MNRLAVVIVTWNGRHLLKGCLASLRKQTFRDFKTLLVDNGSADGTISFVRGNYPEIEIIELDRNHGFAHPNNLGIRKALKDPDVQFIVTLNNDTQVDPEYLAELVRAAERNSTAGSIQPKVINYFEKEVIDSAGILIAKDMSAINRGSKEKDEGQYDIEEEIFGASASAALYTREALEAVSIKGKDGGPEFFDSDYFAYYEDVDLAWRLRLAGFKSFYAPAASVYHVHSATGKSYSPFKAFYVHRNQFLNILKNLPFLQMIRALFLMCRLYAFSLASIVRGRGPAHHLARKTDEKRESMVPIVIRGWAQVVCLLPGMLHKRAQVQASRRVSSCEIESWFRRFQADWKRIVFG